MKHLQNELRILYKNPNELKLNTRNSRTHSKKQLHQIAKSIEAFGFNNPVLIDEASSIIKTQVIRGALGKTKGVFAKIKAIIPLIVPLIVQTIKKSESLADAITMRCFK